MTIQHRIATFVDPQGAQQTDAAVYCKSAYFSRNVSQGYELGTDANSENETSRDDKLTLNCSFCYWTSAAAKTSGAAAYPLINTDDNSEVFSFDVPVSDSEDHPRDLALAHFENVIRPTLT